MGLQVTTNLLACLFSALLLAEVMSAAAGTEMKVTTTPMFPKIPRAHTNKDFQMLLRVEAPAAADLKGRVNIDLVAVVDVAEDKNLEPVKKAIKFAIRQLNNDDHLTILSTPNSQEVLNSTLLSRGGRRTANKKVDQLKGHGSAQQSSGLDEIFKKLEDPPASSDGRARFIVLVTDANSGSIAGMPDSFKYPVHTFGMGASHDARSLRDIAHRSKGTYSFLDDDNVDKITGALALCLGGLKSVAAVDTRVNLKPATGSGVRVTRIRSGSYTSSVTAAAAGEITIGALYAGEVKSFVVHLEVPPASTPLTPEEIACGCDNQQLLVASLNYSGIDTVIQDVLVVQRPPVTVVPNLVPFSIVINQIFQFQWLEIVEIFIANEIVDNDVELGNKLLAKWESFYLERQFWIGLEVGVLVGEITEVAKRRQVAANVFSWFSSYHTQRSTVMGSLEMVVGRVFLTLEVRMTLQMAITVIRGLVIDDCDYGCVDPVPPNLLVAGENNTFYYNDAYKDTVTLNDINLLMSKIYQGLVKASNLKQCPANSD